jgi:hypothetical protein
MAVDRNKTILILSISITDLDAIYVNPIVHLSSR